MRARWVVALPALATIFATPAAQAQSAPSLTADPAVVAPGEPMTLSGSTAPVACSGQAGTVLLAIEDGPELGRVDADQGGLFSLDLLAPPLEQGVHTVTSTCVLGGTLVAPIALATTSLEIVAPTAAVEAPPPSPMPPVTEDQAEQGQSPASGTPPRQLPRTDEEPAVPADSEADDEPAEELVEDVAEAPADPPPAATATDAPATTPIAVERGWKDAPERWGPAQDIRRLTDPDLTAQGLSAAAMLLLAFSLLIGFPATLFDGTYRAHYDQIAAGLRRRLPRTSGAVGLVTRRMPASPLIAMVGFGTLTGAALDPSLGLESRTFGLLAGLAVVIGLAGWLGWWPTKKTSDAYGNDGRYRAYPMGLLVAVLCVLLTRFGNLHPGYLYGLLFAYETTGRWTKRDDGLTFLLGFAAVWVLALAAWLGLSVLQPAAGDDPSIAAIAFDTVLGGLTVAGIEGVVFGMIPFRFAPGHAIWRWSKPAWFGLWIPGALSLAVMLSTPERSLLSVQSEEVSVARAAAAFLVFCIVSVSFWAYWNRRTPRAVTPAPAEEPVTPETAQEDERVLVDA